MSTRAVTVDFLLDQLQNAGRVTARKLFGEYALYCEGKVVALVCDDQLFVKLTAPGRAFVADFYAEGLPYPGAKPWILIDEEQWEDREWLGELINVTAAALPVVKVKLKR